MTSDEAFPFHPEPSTEALAAYFDLVEELTRFMAERGHDIGEDLQDSLDALMIREIAAYVLMARLPHWAEYAPRIRLEVLAELWWSQRFKEPWTTLVDHYLPGPDLTMADLDSIIAQAGDRADTTAQSEVLSATLKDELLVLMADYGLVDLTPSDERVILLLMMYLVAAQITKQDAAGYRSLAVDALTLADDPAHSAWQAILLASF